MQTKQIKHVCIDVESHAEALVAPLRRTVEELDKLYDSVKNQSGKETKVRQICSAIDELLLNLKEMVSATTRDVHHATATTSLGEKSEKNDCKTEEDNNQ